MPSPFFALSSHAWGTDGGQLHNRNTFPKLDGNIGMTHYHTRHRELHIVKAKLAVTFDAKTLAEVDLLVKRRIFSSRSSVIEEAVVEKLARLNHSRLAKECALLDPVFEKAMAEEGM